MNWWKAAARRAPLTSNQVRQKHRKEVNNLKNLKIRLAAEHDPDRRAELQRKIELAEHGVARWGAGEPVVSEWNPVADGKYRDGGAEYRVSDIISHAEGLPVTMMDVDTLVARNGETGTKEGLFSEQVANPSEAFRARAERADLRFPILVDRDGWIVDGSHRLAKAKWEGRREIAAKIVDVSHMGGGQRSGGEEK